MVGQQVGSYRITAKVSQGGMGTVYRAVHTLLNKTVAIKVLNPELSHNKGMVERFFNEARATTAIRHPGIVEVLDFGYATDLEAYLVMEFLEGEPLSRRVKRKRKFSENEAAILVRGMCSPLAAAHAMGIVHRDLKPDNIFLVPDEDMPLGVRPKLLDFGIAKLSSSDLAEELGTPKTRTGSVLGTPTYMAPEQCRGVGDVDHRADLYSLGCILYELVAMRPPFHSAGAGELIGSHLYVIPDSPRKHGAEISDEFEALIMCLLAKAPDQRIGTAVELGQALNIIAANASRHEPVSLSPMVSPLPHVPTGTGLASSPSLQQLLRTSPPSMLQSVPASVLELPKPTTLGSMASESIAPVAHGRASWLRPAIIGGALAGAALAGYLVVVSGDKSTRLPSDAPPAMVQPAKGDSSLTLQPLPVTPPKPEVIVPDLPTPPKPAEVTPPVVVTETKPDTKPDKTPDTKPADPTPTVASKPKTPKTTKTDKTREDSKPTTTTHSSNDSSTKPTTADPVSTKPKTPKTTTTDGPIETDID